MAAKPPDAFLSYTRFDDQYHGGAISAFRDQLSMAVRAVTATPFEIFQDVDGIELGENWRERLNIALGETRFFAQSHRRQTGPALEAMCRIIACIWITPCP